MRIVGLKTKQQQEDGENYAARILTTCVLIMIRLVLSLQSLGSVSCTMSCYCSLLVTQLGADRSPGKDSSLECDECACAKFRGD